MISMSLHTNEIHICSSTMRVDLVLPSLGFPPFLTGEGNPATALSAHAKTHAGTHPKEQNNAGMHSRQSLCWCASTSKCMLVCTNIETCCWFAHTSERMLVCSRVQTYASMHTHQNMLLACTYIRMLRLCTLSKCMHTHPNILLACTPESIWK